jgi:sulfoxide reductase heme-binding subunit YedZ
VVPFRGAYQPVWLGLGTLALDTVLAIVVTSLLRARLGVRAWRAVHWLAYAAWPLALLHGLWVGSDASEPWLLATAVTCAAVVAAGVVWRVALPSGLDSPR